MASITMDALKSRIGEEIGVSDWVTVDQAMIDTFADATGDHQFIHVNPEAAKATPFGGTIAHGFLTLSLMPMLAEKSDLPMPEGLKMAVNYGGNSVRFLTPVRSGSRVRGRFALIAIEDKRSGQFQQTIRYTLEIEGQDKPALIAEWINQLFT